MVPLDASARLPESVVKGQHFKARFNGRYWVARWTWKDEPNLTCRKAQSVVPAEIECEFEIGVVRWISEDWLSELEGQSVDKVTGLVPLMAIMHRAISAFFCMEAEFPPQKALLSSFFLFTAAGNVWSFSKKNFSKKKKM